MPDIGSEGVCAPYRSWADLGRGGQPELQDRYRDLVYRASDIKEFTNVVVPGLLQTAEYAHVPLLHAAKLFGFGELRVEAAVNSRLARQHLLWDSGKQFSFLVDEAVLRRRICPVDVHLQQLDRLLAAIEAVTCLTVAVLPLDVSFAGSPPPDNPFAIFDDGLVTAETVTGELWLQDRTEVDVYLTMWERMWALSAHGGSAIDVVRSARRAFL